MLSNLRLVALTLACLIGIELNGQNTISHDHYWSVRPLSFLTFNPNIQFGTRLKAKDSFRRIYLETGFCYPLGKTYLDRYVYYSDIDARMIGLQIEQRCRFVGARNRFWSPVIEVDYRRYSYIHSDFKMFQPDMEYINFRLGFENGKYFVNAKRGVQAIYWGFAFRYTQNFIQKNNFYSIGDVEYNRLGLKLYLNWQIGGGYKAVYKRKY